MSTTQLTTGRAPRLSAGAVRAILAPVLVCVAVLAAVIASQLGQGGHGLTRLIKFGSQFAADIHPPAGAPVSPGAGYDGQFFYLQALDPLLLHHSTVAGLRAAGAAFRAQRAGYPLLAWLLAAGRPAAIPFTLLAVNVLVLLAVAVGCALYFRRRGWSPWWALAIALMPGMLLSLTRDLSDPLATAMVLAGLVCWQERRRWAAAVALGLAVLTREVTVLVLVAIAADLALHAWRARYSAGGWRPVAVRAWPVLVVPTLIFLAWQAYVIARFGGPVGDAGTTIPVWNLVQEVRWSFQTGPLFGIFDLTYVLLLIAAIVAAAAALRRRWSVTAAAVLALTPTVLVAVLGDIWSDTRVSAPLFALLLVDGLRRGDRRALRIGAAAASLSVLLPLVAGV